MMATHLTKKDAWNEYEMVIVKDEDYDEAMEIMADRLPNEKRLRILEVLHEAN